MSIILQTEKTIFRNIYSNKFIYVHAISINEEGGSGLWRETGEMLGRV